MKSRPLLILGTASLALCLPSLVRAELILTERITSLSTYFLYGGGDGTFPGSNSYSNGSLTSDFISEISGAESHEGYTGETTWYAGIQYQLNQQLELSSNSIVSSGSTDLHSFLAGDGYSDISGRNELQLSFTNTSAMTFSLVGAVGSESVVALERFNGSDWESVFTALGSGGFDAQGVLEVGQFRLTGLGITAATGQQQGHTAWYYDFAVVPEPSTLAAVALGGLFLLRRTKRK